MKSDMMKLGLGFSPTVNIQLSAKELIGVLSEIKCQNCPHKPKE